MAEAGGSSTDTSSCKNDAMKEPTLQSTMKRPSQGNSDQPPAKKKCQDLSKAKYRNTYLKERIRKEKKAEIAANEENKTREDQLKIRNSLLEKIYKYENRELSNNEKTEEQYDRRLTRYIAEVEKINKWLKETGNDDCDEFDVPELRRNEEVRVIVCSKHIELNETLSDIATRKFYSKTDNERLLTTKEFENILLTSMCIHNKSYPTMESDMVAFEELYEGVLHDIRNANIVCRATNFEKLNPSCDNIDGIDVSSMEESMNVEVKVKEENEEIECKPSMSRLSQLIIDSVAEDGDYCNDGEIIELDDSTDEEDDDEEEEEEEEEEDGRKEENIEEEGKKIESKCIDVNNMETKKEIESLNDEAFNREGAASTIVIDDEDEDDDKYVDGDGDGPSQLPNETRWPRKREMIVKWLNESGKGKVEIVSVEDYEDSDVECILDDFEMDSVSHSALRPYQPNKSLVLCNPSTSTQSLPLPPLPPSIPTFAPSISSHSFIPQHSSSIPSHPSPSFNIHSSLSSTQITSNPSPITVLPSSTTLSNTPLLSTVISPPIPCFSTSITSNIPLSKVSNTLENHGYNSSSIPTVTPSIPLPQSIQSSHLVNDDDCIIID